VVRIFESTFLDNFSALYLPVLPVCSPRSMGLRLHCFGEGAEEPSKARQAFDKGLEELKKNDPAASLVRFAQAAAAFPNYYEAYYQMGLGDMQLGRKEEAERALQTAIDLSGGHYPPAQYALGVLFCQRREFAEGERVIR
jgi:tetratricopeptide (TPR) repeat protein